APEAGGGGWGDGGSMGGSGGGSVTGSGGGGAAGGEEPAPSGPVRYRDDELRSPITEHVAEGLRAIRERAPHRPDVFMTVGASGTVSTRFLYCFAGEAGSYLDLDGRDHLLAGIDHYLAGDAAGTTPFDRPTIAAKV